VPADGARDVPDVALAASPVRYPYLIVSSGITQLVGGTSVSTEAFAGIVALLNQYLVTNGSLPQAGLGNLNPNLYRLAQSTSGVFHDVTAGNNYLPCLQASLGCTELGLGYAAGAGYDLTTGLGSVDANQLVTQWSIGPAPAVTLTATPSTAALNDTVRLTATVTGSGPAPTGSVTFVSNDTALGTVALSSGQIGLTVAGTALESGGGVGYGGL
jgi:subtilase family serine protease